MKIGLCEEELKLLSFETVKWDGGEFIHKSTYLIADSSGRAV